jgi:hypothetical protein
VDISDQLAAYERYWRTFSAQIVSGKGIGELTESESRVVCATIVARLPSAVASALVDALKPLIERFPEHYYYPVETIHLTLTDLSLLFDGSDFSKISLATARALSVLEEELSDEPPMKLRVQGFGLFPTTVFGQLLDLDGRVTDLRERVGELLRREVGAVLRPAVAPGLVFANVARYSVPPSAGVVDEIARFRECPRLSFEAANFEIVTTDKVLSRRNTTVHGRLKFAGLGLNPSPSQDPDSP